MVFFTFKWCSISVILLFLEKLYIERNVDVLIIGEPGAGKTGLFHSLINPDIPETEILKLSASGKINVKRKRTSIPMGKFHIIPKLLDVPGSQYAAINEQIVGTKHHALVVVVSFTRTNRLERN